MKKYHIVYKTTHIPSSKFYIGRHSTNNVNDNYLGSGIKISRLIKLHSKNEFKKDILIIHDNINDMILSEEYFIRNSWNDPLNLNMIIGDPYYTGWIEISDEVRDKLSKIHKGKKLSEEHKEKISKYHKGKKRTQETISKMITNHKGMTGQKLSDDHKEKLKISMQAMSAGELNGFYGKTHSDETKAKFSKERKNKILIIKDTVRKRINPQEFEFYKNEGWIRCELTKIAKNSRKLIYINNTIKCKRIKKELLPEFLENGWIIGRIFKF